MEYNIKKLQELKENYYNKILEIDLKIEDLLKKEEIKKSLTGFKEVVGYPNYLISRNGEIYSLKNNIFIKKWKNNKGYNTVCLWNNGKQRTVLIHRLVAETFIPNPNNYKEVNHKDFNLDNNSDENLEWCTRDYNIYYSINAGRISNAFAKIKINQLDKDGNLIREWDSIKEAAQTMKIDKASISKCCKNKQKTCNGFIWKYKQN